MRKRLKLVLMFTMFTALCFGFLHLFVPDRTLYNFERLHIFLFNLVAGGTILIHFTEDNPGLTTKGKLFFTLSFIYALLAFWEFYLPATVVAFVLAALVESVRIKKFSFFPTNFFNPRERVPQKFHQAALLCLSIGLIIFFIFILFEMFIPQAFFANPEIGYPRVLDRKGHLLLNLGGINVDDRNILGFLHRKYLLLMTLQRLLRRQCGLKTNCLFPRSQP